MSYTPEIENAATQWLTKHRATTDPVVLSKIVGRAHDLWDEDGGRFCVAHIGRAYLGLCSEKQIQPFKGNMQEKLDAPIPREVIDFVEFPRTGAW